MEVDDWEEEEGVEEEVEGEETRDTNNSISLLLLICLQRMRVRPAFSSLFSHLIIQFIRPFDVTFRTRGSTERKREDSIPPDEREYL